MVATDIAAIMRQMTRLLRASDAMFGLEPVQFEEVGTWLGARNSWKGTELGTHFLLVFEAQFQIAAIKPHSS